MENFIIIIAVLMFIGFFIYFKVLQIKKTEKKFYTELKQKCMDLCIDINYITDDTLEYLNDKKIFLKYINLIDKDDTRYYELEEFISEEANDTDLLRKTNNEYMGKLHNLESLSVDQSNLKLCLDKKNYCLKRKKEMINKYKDFYDELDIENIFYEKIKKYQI